MITLQNPSMKGYSEPELTLFLNIQKKEKALEKKQSTTDTLTSIYNRRYFMERANQEWDLVKRQNRILSIVMMNIDHFKRINDEHGHDVGDFILKETASLLTESIRLSDVLARYGGEEFIALFTGYPKEEAFFWLVCAFEILLIVIFSR